MAIGLGCMRLSTEPTRDPVRGRAVIAAALTAGIELLDTADAYALDDTDVGHNERLIADALAELGGHRTVEVVTKGGLVRPGGAWQTNGRANHLAAAARASRDRLGVAALDLYLLHAVDPKTPLSTSVRALARLRDDGIATRIGLSNVGLTQLEAALAITPIDAVEIELSPWKLDAIRGGLVAACAAHGIRVLAHRPLGGPAGVRRATADPVLRALAKRLDASPAQLILAWLSSLSPNIVPLPGATQIETATCAARAATLVLDPDAQAALATRFLSIPGLSDSISKPAPTHSIAKPAPTRSVAKPAPTDPMAKPAPTDSVLSSSERDTRSASSEIVIILGMPASGKSTLAAEYETRGYLRLNRDQIGGPLIAIAQRLDQELARGARRVVIDNTYPSRASRAPIVEIARRHGSDVRCLVLAISLEDAQANAVARIIARHGRLLMPGVGADNELGRAKEIDPRAQFRYRRDYEAPREDEGFASVEMVPFVRATAPTAGIAPSGGLAAIGRPALIVELDDIVWRGRPRTAAAIELRAGAREALVAWSPTHVLAGTTWQPGLARSDELRARLVELLGIELFIAHCAHAAGPPVCWCRKPLPGLAFALAHTHGLDLARTLHVGKGPADRGFALRAGIRYIDIANGWPAPPDPRRRDHP